MKPFTDHDIRRLNVDIPKPLKKRMEECGMLWRGTLKQIITVMMHEALDRLEGENKEEEMAAIMKRYTLIHKEIVSGPSYERFRSE